MTDVQLLLIGDSDRRETRAVAELLAGDDTVEQSSDLDEAIERLTAGAPLPDLIVLVQTRPGQFRGDRLDQLRRIAPLARVLLLSGSWCDGELRSGRQLEGITRVAWHQWVARWRQERERLEERRCPLYGLPATATDDERLLDLAEQSPRRGNGLIVIHSPRQEMADWLSDACTRLGYSTVWAEPHRAVSVAAPRAVIWDADEFDAAQARGLRSLRERSGAVPALVLVGFPRSQSYGQALAAGATALLAKPLLLSDLSWCVDQMLSSSELAESSQAESATGTIMSV